MERIRSIQVLRFLAALVVVHNHALLYTHDRTHSFGVLGLGHLSDIGPCGVDAFFVISGFVIAMVGPLAAKRPTGAGFWWMRFSRVAPFWYVMSSPWLILCIIFGVLAADRAIATLFFWPGFGASAVLPYPTVGWTLCFEMMFYTAVSCLLIGGNLRRNCLIGGAVMAVLVVARAFNWGPAHTLANPVFLEFGFGVALAAAYRRLRMVNPWVGVGLFVAALGLLAIPAIVGTGGIEDGDRVLRDTLGLTRVMVFGLPAALLLAGALIAEPLVKGRIAAIGARLGDASYALYLAHPLTLIFLGWAWGKSPHAPNADLMTLVDIAVCVAAGYGAHRFIETPVLRDVRALGRRLARRPIAALA